MSVRPLDVDVEHDRKTGRLEPQHCSGEQIACDCLDHVLDERAIPSTLVVPATLGVVLEDDLRRAWELARSEARLRICDAPPARECQIERALAHVASDLAARDPLACEHRAFGSALEPIPELCRRRMRDTPGLDTGQDGRIVALVIGREAPPCADRSAETASQFRYLAHSAPGFVVGRDRTPQNF